MSKTAAPNSDRPITTRRRDAALNEDMTMHALNDYAYLSAYFCGRESKHCYVIERPATEDWFAIRPSLSLNRSVWIGALLDYSGCIDADMPADYRYWSYSAGEVVDADLPDDDMMLARDESPAPSLPEAVCEGLPEASRNLLTIAPIDPCGRMGFPRRIRD